MDIRTILMAPPAAFVIVMVTMIIVSLLLSRLSFRSKNESGEGRKSYACGEDVPTSLIQPEYGQFFPFAFFFTILHVVTLMITTLPVETIQSFTIAIIYIAGAVVGLMILFRR
jgi:NADH:ubiquinone oxidoreductase subunit 3 (subunit A)